MTSEPAADGVGPLDYRHALGRFATGIVVVTTAFGGEDHAMTVNSFASVSLDPPLVLFSCEKIARFHDAITHAGIWAVSILGEHQREASRWFASRGRRFEGQFDAFETRRGSAVDALVLTGSLAVVECRTVGVYDGGDHSVMVGEVVAVDVSAPEEPPLLYFEGGYHTLSG